MEQEADWDWFAENWDMVNAEAHGEDWEQYFSDRILEDFWKGYLTSVRITDFHWKAFESLTEALEAIDANKCLGQVLFLLYGTNAIIVLNNWACTYAPSLARACI